MDIGTLMEVFGGMLQVFVPAKALPYVPVILIMVWLSYQYFPSARRWAPLLALALGLAVSFLFLQQPWREAVPAGLTLGGYAIAMWELGGKNILQLWERAHQEPRPPTQT